MNRHLQNILEIIQQDNQLSDDQKNTLLASLKEAGKEFEITAFKLERTEKVKRTTAILLEETIEELEQKRKAVEAQNRELEIEAALERVRAKAMAMQHSDELAEASQLLDEQVRSLGIETWGCAFHIYGEDSPGSPAWDMEWFSSQAGILTPYKTPRERFFKKYYDIGKEGKSLYIEEIGENEIIEHYEYLKSLPVIGDSLREAFNSGVPVPKSQIDHVAYFGQGHLLFITYKPVPEAHDIFVRFAKVFEQAYTRFLDLKNAEAQVREAQIEAALERVRSNTMAMHNSQEVGETVIILFDELRKLGLDELNICGIGIMQDQYVMEAWTASKISKSGTELVVGHIDMKQHALLKEVYEGWQSKKESFQYELNGKNKLNYFENINSQAGYQAGRDISTLPPEIVANAFYFNEGCLYAFASKKHSAEKTKIYNRFAGLFGQTYRRFLDLQKAEKQAREAQIEAALERIRSLALGMQKSEEVGKVSDSFFNEFNKLTIKIVGCSIVILEEDKDIMEIWRARSNVAIKPFNKTSLSEALEIMKERTPEWFVKYKMGIDTKSGIYAESLVGEKRFRFLSAIAKQNHFSDEEEIRFLKMVPDKMEFSLLFFKLGYLAIISEQKLPEENLTIARRFADVFDFAYTRFLDLKKAEAQAREAQIEAALERVRSRTMGMQKSVELQEVINRIFIEITGLGVEMDSSYIITHLDEDITRGFATWVSSKELSYASKLHMAYINHPLVHKFYDAWQNKKPWFSASFTKAEKNTYFRHQFKNSPELSQIPEARKKVILDGNGWSISWVILKNAAIIIQRYQNKPFSESEVLIQKRFARVFEQTYTRFLDLKKAEAQAHEAVKQASLDRVRGEIASMRNSEDLNRITPVIWRELQALEVPFIRCGVFIVDEKTKIVHVYLSTPDGKAIGVLNLNFEVNKLTKDTVEHWRINRILRTHWNKEEFINWTKSMMELGQVKSAETYQGAENAPESLSLHFVPFKQGMLYVGDILPLTDEKINLVKTLAEAFSIAYARYEDFRNLEEAKNKIESTLNDLKAAQTQLIHAEKMASLGELTAGIAHEIQNPLNFVNNFSDVSIDLIEEMLEELESGNSGEVKLISSDIKENLQKIRNHGQRASGIVKGMLQHSRGNTGQKELTDINALADEYLRLAYHGLRAKDKSFNSDFKLETDDTLPKIEVIPQDIGRVILNLINNAFYAVLQKAGSGSNNYKPEVIVKTKKTDGKLELTIKDNGSGIPENIKNKIFQPFFTTKPTGQGTGLGLSLSYDIVTKGHNGKMEVESSEENGTEFIITLPV